VTRVELPLASAQIIGGFRSASLQVVSTAVLAPLVGLGGLGFGIVQGLSLRQFDQVVGSGIIIVVLALSLDSGLAVLQRMFDSRLRGVQSSKRARSQK
jgi:osmoprotectant transport system permease protein